MVELQAHQQLCLQDMHHIAQTGRYEGSRVMMHILQALAKRPKRIPVVLSPEEVLTILSLMHRQVGRDSTTQTRH
jgi:hypothetical protein